MGQVAFENLGVEICLRAQGTRPSQGLKVRIRAVMEATVQTPSIPLHNPKPLTPHNTPLYNPLGNQE